MQTRLKMSRDGLELLKGFEGLRLAAARLPDGRWTMGHGHTQYAREGATITAADAEAFLIYDLIPVAAVVNEEVIPQVSQSQFDALVCFAFNVGVEAFRQSAVLQRVNQERMTEAALAMAIWRSGAFDGRRVVLDALVRRRSAEEALLLGRDGPPAPSDLVRPQIDPDAEASLPETSPVEVEVQFDGETVSARPAGDGVATPDVPDAPAGPVPGHDEAEAVVEQSEDAVAEPVIEAVPEAGRDAAEPAEAAEPDPVAGGAEPIVHVAQPSTLADGQAGASLSTRMSANYQPERFSPITAADSKIDDLETTGLMEPSLDGQIDEPPLVLVLTPPPEVGSEPPSFVEAEPAAPAEPMAPSGSQTPLFEGVGDRAPAEADSVIYYEPLAETDDRASRWSDTGAYVATGIVGLAAFGFGIAGFQLAGQDPAPAGMFNEKTAISWVLVSIGVVCVWISAYNLFKRLGGPDAEA